MLGTLLLLALPAGSDAAVKHGMIALVPGASNTPDSQVTESDKARLEAIRAAGATDLRIPAIWAYADRLGTVNAVDGFDWEYQDRIIGALARAGLRPYPYFGYPPPSCSMAPRHTLGGNPNLAVCGSKASTFIYAFVRRYGRGGSFWAANPEIPPQPIHNFEAWNEPNLTGGTWHVNDREAGQPEEYAGLYVTVRQAAHMADPAIVVSFGSLAPLIRGSEAGTWSDPVEFLRRSVASRSNLQIDAISYHPYLAFVKSKGPIGHVVFHMRRMAAAMRSLGLGDTRLELTELGIPSEARFLPPPDDSIYLTDQQRAATLSSLMSRTLHGDCGNVGSVFPIVWNAPRQVSWAEVQTGLGSHAYYEVDKLRLTDMEDRLLPPAQAVIDAYASDPQGAVWPLCRPLTVQEPAARELTWPRDDIAVPCAVGHPGITRCEVRVLYGTAVVAQGSATAAGTAASTVTVDAPVTSRGRDVFAAKGPKARLSLAVELTATHVSGDTAKRAGAPGDLVLNYDPPSGFQNETIDGVAPPRLPPGPCDSGSLGGNGNDVLRGAPSGESIRGLAGDDRIDGRGGADCLGGDAGRDDLRGGTGPDRLYGGRGNDYIRAEGGARDRVDCGSGRDVAVVDRADRVRGNCERIVRRG